MEGFIIAVVLLLFVGAYFVEKVTTLVKTLQKGKVFSLPAGNKKIGISITTENSNPN
jgi:hypothetical protein